MSYDSFVYSYPFNPTKLSTFIDFCCLRHPPDLYMSLQQPVSRLKIKATLNPIPYFWAWLDLFIARASLQCSPRDFVPSSLFWMNMIEGPLRIGVPSSVLENLNLIAWGYFCCQQRGHSNLSPPCYLSSATVCLNCSYNFIAALLTIMSINYSVYFCLNKGLAGFMLHFALVWNILLHYCIYFSN